MKRYSTSLLIREIQIKTILQQQLTPIRMANIEKKSYKCWWGCGETEILMHSLEKTLMLGNIEGRRRRGWEGWMASLSQWTWVWANSGRLWWTGKPDVLQSMDHKEVGRLSNWTATTPCTVGGNVKWCSHCETVPQKIKPRITIWSSNFPSGYIPKRIERRDLNFICTPMFTTVLYTVAKI